MLNSAFLGYKAAVLKKTALPQAFAIDYFGYVRTLIAAIEARSPPIVNLLRHRVLALTTLREA
jgi:hypothetical protein